MKRRLGIIVLLLLSLVLNGCVGVKTPSYVVSGSVMDKETGEPVSGVEILLNGTRQRILPKKTALGPFPEPRKGPRSRPKNRAGLSGQWVRAKTWSAATSRSSGSWACRQKSLLQLMA